MIVELQVGYNCIGGGDVYYEVSIVVGLLGVDFVVEKGCYRIVWFYVGDCFNFNLCLLLVVLGLGVKEGDFILVINGYELMELINLYVLLENIVGKQVVVIVVYDVVGQGWCDIIVEFIVSEVLLC